MIFLILILVFQTAPMSVSAVNITNYYARILFEQVYLYKTPVEDNSISNIYFEIPKTYFVQLSGVQGDFYKATYLNFHGYVKKDSVQAVDSTPVNPFLDNITFRVYAELSQNLRSEPLANNSNLIIQIPPLTKNIQFIGQINGECLIEGRTNIWYYCKYTNNNSNYYGYIYSDFCDEMTNIKSNNENLNYINNPTFEENIKPINSIPKNSSVVGFVIGILSIPALIFLFLIMKSGKILNQVGS